MDFIFDKDIGYGVRLDSTILASLEMGLGQRGPTTSSRAACSPPRKFVQPAEQFCTSLVDHKQL